ncbi:MAG: response regulator, partial [Planctomycetaceae bacterium]|nr:response regulator [Planctomycetaceae bacterium]
AVLMDIQMPRMDGIQATLEIRKKGGRFAEIPIIAMTAHARREDRNRCLSAGMTGYVSKPIDAEKLLRLIEKLAFRSSPERLSPPPTVEQVETTISSSAPIVDLAMAKKRMGGDQDILDEMIGAFLEDAPVLMSELEQACEANDDVAAHRAAHSLKGLSATFDATPLVNAAFRLEQFAKSQGLLSETPLLKDVQNELERVIQLLSTQTRDQ